MHEACMEAKVVQNMHGGRGEGRASVGKGGRKVAKSMHGQKSMQSAVIKGLLSRVGKKPKNKKTEKPRLFQWLFQTKSEKSMAIRQFERSKFRFHADEDLHYNIIFCYKIFYYLLYNFFFIITGYFPLDFFAIGLPQIIDVIFYH
jgi:hypothetical protein